MPRHEVTRSLPYTVDQMYELVADIERYPDFLPWCAGARIRKRTKFESSEIVDADLVIAFKVFREKFGSRVTLYPDEARVETAYIDGPFKYLNNRWSIVETPSGSDVTCFVDFEFKSMVLQSIIGVVFNEAMARLVHAFEARAHDLYGSAETSNPSA